MTDIERCIAGAEEAHRLLVERLEELTDDQARRPSLLPEWTVGHVLTHLARNAQGVQRMLEGAAGGEVAEMYPGGAAGRAADIEAGAGRPAAALVADVRDTVDALAAAWSALDADGWRGTGRMVTADVPIADLPFLRWREVTVHHSDLGLGYMPADWPEEYVRRELARLTMQWASRRPMGLSTLPAEALAVPEHRRVAWLLGRAEIDGLGPAGVL